MMKTRSSKLFFLCAAGLIAVFSTQAATRQLSLPAYLVNPGGEVLVPVELDNAAGLALITLQINLDPEVLSLETNTVGALGEQFELFDSEENEGVISMSFVRSDNLSSGSGRLAVLSLRMKDGAPLGLTTPIALASYELGDSGGVVALQRKDAVVVANGQVEVSDSTDIDNFGNGLPDWWEEQYGLDLFSMSNMDADGDTLWNSDEFIAGTDPTNGNSVFEISNPGSSPSGFVLNWNAMPGREYGVRWADSLTNGFQTLATNIVYPQNSYTDTVHSADGEGFYSIDVKLEN